MGFFRPKLENGMKVDGSLHNLRVFEAGIKFFGKIILRNADEKIFNLLALAIKNISCAGTKRNRGFGRIKCTPTFNGATSDNIAAKFFAKEA